METQVNTFNFTVSPEASASFHDDGIVILHTGKGCLFRSNGVGAQIWRGLEQRLPWEAIAAELSREYQIALSTARDHALNFLVALEQQTLIQREAAS